MNHNPPPEALVIVDAPFGGRGDRVPVPQSRAAVLLAMGFDARDLKRAYTRNVEALDATLPERRRERQHADGGIEITIELGGAPDWRTRLEAIEQMYGIAGLSNIRLDPSDDRGPVSIRIVVNESPSGPLTSGVRVSMPASEPGRE